MFAQNGNSKEIELHLISPDINEEKDYAQISTNLTAPVTEQKYSKFGIYFTILSVLGTVVGACVWKWNPNLPTVELLTVRSAVGCLSSYFLMKFYNKDVSVQALFNLQNIIVGLFGSLSILTYAISLFSLSISEATTIYATLGIFNGIFGLILLKDSYPNSERILGVFCFLGVILIVKPPFLFGQGALSDISTSNTVTSRFAGGLLCLASTALWSLMQIFLRGASSKSTGFAAIFQLNLIMGVLCGGYLIIRGDIKPIGFEGWVTSVLLAACSLILTWAIIKALEYEKPSVVGIVGYSEIIFAIVADVIVFHTLPSLLTVIGMAMIIGSCLFLIKRAS